MYNNYVHWYDTYIYVCTYSTYVYLCTKVITNYVCINDKVYVSNYAIHDHRMFINPDLLPVNLLGTQYSYRSHLECSGFYKDSFHIL